MKRIFKYGLQPLAGVYGFMMPSEARILWVDFQGTMLCLWAEVEEDSPVRVQRFVVVLTGQQVPDGGKYIGSAQIKDPLEPFVAHVYWLFS